ncbi:MAG: IS4 family transposase, partial [Planctomycetaceae bacterium]|nr:IS4 family transposase [Planctomycetaceae bacterium]
KPLEWMLLTSEPAKAKREARTVIGYYECRWMIEEFHKAWKSGCTIEQRRLQTPENLERLTVITAHVAVRLLQLRCLTHEDPEQPCDILLDDDEWQCLDATTRTKHARFKEPPTLQWVLHTIAKLGGWRDTKRNGRIGWMSLWKGWIRFRERLIAWKIAKQIG